MQSISTCWEKIRKSKFFNRSFGKCIQGLISVKGEYIFIIALEDEPVTSLLKSTLGRPGLSTVKLDSVKSIVSPLKSGYPLSYLV